MNVGLSVRSAAALGCAEVIACGQVSTFGAQGTDSRIDIRRFARLKDAAVWLKARGIAICGIEICEGAVPVQTRPWHGPTAFLAGNEGSGIPLAHRPLCDSFVYVPQFGDATASLNVTVATSIVLHEFAGWAAYTEARREGEKYVVRAPLAGPRMTEYAHDVRAGRVAAAAAKAASRAAGVGVVDTGAAAEVEEEEEEDEGDDGSADSDHAAAAAVGGGDLGQGDNRNVADHPDLDSLINLSSQLGLLGSCL